MCRTRYHKTVSIGCLCWILIFAGIACGFFMASCGKEVSAAPGPTVMRMYNQRWWLKRGSENLDLTYTTWGDEHAEVIQTPDTILFPVADTIYFKHDQDSIRLTYYLFKL